MAYSYNVDWQQTQEKLNGSVIANSAYSSGRLSGIVYPSGSGKAGNGTSLSSVTYSPTGAMVGEGWTFASGTDPLSDTEVLSQSGRVLRDTLAFGTDASFASTYSYDADGRLVGATVPDNTLTYS